MAGAKRAASSAYPPRKTRKLETHEQDDGSELEPELELHEDDSSDNGEEEWGGIEGDASNAATGGLSIRSHMGEEDQHGGKLHKPPTGQELRVIKDAVDLYQSSAFKLQIDALLPNVRPKSSRTATMDRFLLSLHTFLMGLPSLPLQHPLDASRKLLKNGIATPYPLPLPTEDTNWKVSFEKPNDITLVGSWPNKVSIKSKDHVPFGVDIAIEMPSGLFQEKDYLNGRFFHKRAFYLASIAHAIQNESKKFPVEPSYESLTGDPRLTKLVLRHKPGMSSLSTDSSEFSGSDEIQDGTATDFSKLNACVCLIPVASVEYPIPLHRLSPSHANIRIHGPTEEHEHPLHLPTPLYNSALLRHFTLKSHLLAIHSLKNESPAFGNALTLLRVWANQWGYGDGAQLSVRGFHGRGAWWSTLLGCLIDGEERVDLSSRANNRRPLGKGLSSYQLFRAALDFLSKHDFKANPVFAKANNGHLYPPHEYVEHHSVVFVDSTSRLNVLSGVPVGSLEILRHDARQTLETLDRPWISSDAFTEVFLKEHRDILTRFDTVLKVDLSNAKMRTLSSHAVLDSGSPGTALLDSLDSLLHTALTDRAKVIAILHTPPAPRPLSQAHPTSPDIIYIGIVHTQHAFRLVDHGPAADETDENVTAKFRDLWGEKSELRRFKDGRITESVVWDIKTVDERTHIPGMIVRYLLQRHFSIPPSSVVTWQADFDSVLKLPESISSLYHGSGLSLGFKGAITAFDDMVQAIKELGENLPLALTSISSISPLTRYTSVFSPVPLPTSIASSLPPNAQYLAPIEIILEFEKSSRWPDDIYAVQKIKLAFFERIAASLMTAIKGLKASVVTGDGVSDLEIVDQSYLEIVTPDGWAFCARIWHDREVMLLDRIIDGRNGVLPHVTLKVEDKKQDEEYYHAVEAKEVLARQFVHGPRHHRAIASIAHQFPAFSGTVRLVKRWLASHWLLNTHVSEEVVELICAGFFISGGQRGKDDDDQKTEDRASIPGSKERGFAVVVNFLQNWGWEEGLFVPLYAMDTLSQETGDQPPSSGLRASSVWSVKTELDRSGQIWTHGGPDVVAAHRVRSLAKGTWEYLRSIESGEFDAKSMLVHPIEDYDFVVELDKSALRRYQHGVTADPVSLSRLSKRAGTVKDVMPGFDPAYLLFSDLQRIYANSFRLFYDVHGGDRYAGVWDPSLKDPRPFRVLGNFSSMPVRKAEKVKDKGMVALNKESVLAEIQRLGSGLVSKVVRNT